MVFQSYALYPHMTVYENMAFSMRIARASKQDIDSRVRKAAEILQLTEYLDRLPKALSGGQRQRVAIGRAIVRDPKVFLFDEPLSNLDAALRVATRIEIAKLNESMPDTTMIYVTHDQVEAMTLADRIVVLNGGEVEQIGTPQEVYSRPASTFVASFIGAPPMNLVGAEVTDAGLHIGGQVLPQPGPHRGHVTLGLRPERARIGNGSGGIRLDVGAVEELGANRLIHGRIGETEITVAQDADLPVPVGQVSVAFRPEDVHFFDPETGRRL